MDVPVPMDDNSLNKMKGKRQDRPGSSQEAGLVSRALRTRTHAAWFAVVIIDQECLI